MPRCEFCGEEVNPRHSQTYHAITGWEQKRTQGGANQITLREYADPPSFAHSRCVDLRRHGIAPGQEALL